MSEEETAKRIDANILDIDINELPKVSEDEIINKFNKVKDNFGELIIKEYPAGTFNTLHLEALLNELENKGFIPDVVMIDYLGLMASSRTTLQKAGGTYMYVKTIAEECHGFAKKYNLPVVSAAQLNRCLDKNTIVEKENGVKTKIKDINVGDIIKGYNGYVEVKAKTKTQKQKRYKVTLKSGKTIIVSKNHRFPTKFGLMSIENGLEEGTLIKTEGSADV
jgi:replicative DNA helicase